MKFSTKLIILFSGLFLAWSLVVIYSIYIANVKILDRNVTINLADNAFHTVNQIKRMLYERYLDIRELASDPVISTRNSPP